MSDGVGKEIVSVFDFDGFNNGGKFFTDSNGRQMMTRTRFFPKICQLFSSIDKFIRTMVGPIMLAQRLLLYLFERSNRCAGWADHCVEDSNRNFKDHSWVLG